MDCASGMGQSSEAHTLITESYQGLKAALGDAAQVVGESQYYLAMVSLLTADTEDAVAQTDPMLMQVSNLCSSARRAHCYLPTTPLPSPHPAHSHLPATNSS